MVRTCRVLFPVKGNCDAAVASDGIVVPLKGLHSVADEKKFVCCVLAVHFVSDDAVVLLEKIDATRIITFTFDFGNAGMLRSVTYGG
eukprot:CAMPEP_0171295980 /NCGR_PEP_ID=MMETSP0816-20121228/4657_1 /TAXON_ID=420281 /ORGANISM="Proboscia inermis, Strain CCAP1064/1" /LENGTH=86 /DNA_ID=CAMNT_0011769085 /DNA_START=423 /DNA_END=679 /DNA_ORIENTATION=-